MSAAFVSPLRSPAAVASRPRSAEIAPATLWRVWSRRIRSRRALTALHPEQIREAGLDPHVVRREIQKPFWRA